MKVRYRFQTILETLRWLGHASEEETTVTSLERALRGEITRQTIAKLLDDGWTEHFASLEKIARLAIFLGCEPKDVVEWKADPGEEGRLAGIYKHLRADALKPEVQPTIPDVVQAFLRPADDATALWWDSAATEQTKQACLPDGGSWLLVLAEGRNLFGRGVEMEASPPQPPSRLFLFSDPTGHLSREHLALHWYALDGVLEAQDLGSVNHTSLQRRGGPIQRLFPDQKRFLQTGDLLILGQPFRSDLSKRFRFEMAGLRG